MTRRVFLIAACALILPFGGCDLFGGTDSPDSLAGSWRGTITTQDSNYTLTLNLEQPPDAGTQRSPVSGDGRLAGADTSWTFTISGTFSKPSLFLSLRFQTARPSQLEGTVGDDLKTIDAVIFGGPVSFDAVSVPLERQ